MLSDAGAAVGAVLPESRRFGEALDSIPKFARFCSGLLNCLAQAAFSACACLSMVPASLTSNLFGASMFSVFTTPSTTSIE
jgi:hypothetical protein